MLNNVLTQLARIAYMHNPSTIVEVRSERVLLFAHNSYCEWAGKPKSKQHIHNESTQLVLIVNGKEVNRINDPVTFRKHLLGEAAGALFIALMD